jgi:hypothetical protein
MQPILLDYGLLPNRTAQLLRKLKFVAIGIAVACITIVGRYSYVALLHEWSLQQEEKRLLTANAPSAIFPSLTVQFTPGGDVILPDGRIARLAEIDLSDPGDQQRLPTDFANLERLIKAQKIGYTITSFDGNVLPAVHLWALSPNEYGPLCGNTGREARRICAWLLWRNVNATLMEERGFNWNGTQSERAVLHAKVN